MAETGASAPDPTAAIRSRSFVVLLVLAALVGVAAALAAWGLLELIHQIQVGVYTDLPKDLGFDHTPQWWSLPVLGIAGLVVAFAVERLPGRGGHVPAKGLATGGATQPIQLPGVVLAALATVGLGAVLGPEAPLIALGSGVGVLFVRMLRRDGPPQVAEVLAAAGTFAAMTLIFDSPLIAAVILIEAAGLGGPRLRVVLLPGLIASGIGSLISIGMGSWTGLSSKDYAISSLALASFPRPDVADFLWTVPLAAAIAAGSVVVVAGALRLLPVVTRRPFIVVPAAGLAVAGLAIAFSEATNESVNEVLFSGQAALPGLIADASAFSIGTLVLLIACKGLAWCVSLASFRGGPTFPAMYLGAAAGLLAAHLPGLSSTPAVAVGIAAGVAAVLRLPLSAVVLGIVLTADTAPGASPLIIVGAVTAYLTAIALAPPAPEQPAPAAAKPAAAPGGRQFTPIG